MKGANILALFIVLAFLSSVGMMVPMSLAQDNTRSIVIHDFAFNPSNITVSQGMTVTWTNEDNVTHTVFSDSYGPDSEPVFPSGPIAPGGTYSFTFNQAGIYGYHDTIYPHMTGTVTVIASGAGGDQAAGNRSTASGEAPSSNWTHMAVAHLDTKNVPGVGNATNSSHAEGIALFWMDQSANQMNYMLFVSNATNITMAHIHEWSNGTLGPIVVWLYPQNTPSTTTPAAILGGSNGMMVVGNFSAADFVGPLQNKSMSDLVMQMDSNNTLAAWHSTEYPSAYMIGNITTNLSAPTTAALMRQLGPQHTLQAGNPTNQSQ